MLNIENIKNNVKNLKKNLSSLNIDSIFLEKDGKLDKVFYNDECLHELRSCSKILVAMAIGIAIDKGMFSLDTIIYPSLERDLLTHTSGYEKQMMSESYIQDIDKNNLLDYALNYDIPFEVATWIGYNKLDRKNKDMVK